MKMAITTSTKQKASRARTMSATARKKKTRKDGDAATVLPFTWTATEYGPRHRWWWYPVLGYIALVLALGLFLYGNWSTAILTIVLTVALMMFAAMKPRIWHYVLTADQIAITLPHRPRFNRTHPVERFRSFTIQEMTGSKREPATSLLVLLPRRWFATELDIFLTGDEKADLAIAAAIETVLPYDEAPSYQATERVFNRLARWLRLG